MRFSVRGFGRALFNMVRREYYAGKERKTEKIIAVTVAVILIVALLVGMVSCSSGKEADLPDGTENQLSHYPVAVVTRPTEDGNEGTEGTEVAEGTENIVSEEGNVGTESVIDGSNSGSTETETKSTGMSETVNKVSETVKTTEPTTPKATESNKTVETTEPKATEATEPKETTPKATEPTVTETKTSGDCSHSWVLAKHVEGTCVQYERYDYVCSLCGETMNETYVVYIPHTYTSTVVKSNTCTEDGLMSYTCSVCGDTYTEVIPAEHTWVHYHEDAEGYDERGMECRCGWTCWESEAEAAGYNLGQYFYFYHQSLHNTIEERPNHTYDEVMRSFTTKPAVDYDYCIVCNLRKES